MMGSNVLGLTQAKNGAKTQDCIFPSTTVLSILITRKCGQMPASPLLCFQVVRKYMLPKGLLSVRALDRAFQTLLAFP